MSKITCLINCFVSVKVYVSLQLVLSLINQFFDIFKLSYCKFENIGITVNNPLPFPKFLYIKFNVYNYKNNKI